jgi:hypothetical protein
MSAPKTPQAQSKAKLQKRANALRENLLKRRQQVRARHENEKEK